MIFMPRIKADSRKQTELVRIIGHSNRITPNTDHSAKPITVSSYMRVEIAAVSPVMNIFHA